ncbi:MAG: DNA polymerase V [Enterobacterales bacterium]|jgi:DNA polymerase V
MKVIPIYIEAGITGFESPAAEYTELGLSLDELIIKHPNATFIGLANGDSMKEVGIFDGDLLIVDRSEATKHGDVIVANFNGNFVCKIIDKKRKELLSASADYKAVPISEADVFQIEGVVICSVRLHRKSKRLTTCLH